MAYEYVCQGFVDGQLLTAECLNKMEKGIEEACKNGGGSGTAGADGKSAYEVAVENGFIGTETEWLESLVGETGPAGRDGQDGVPGEPGTPGQDGLTPHIGANGNWWIGDTDTRVKAEGVPGKDGNDGYTPVKGKDYFDGEPGSPGRDGVDGKDGEPGPAGKTPVKGEDYFTEADKQEIVEEVKAGINIPEGGGIDVSGAEIGQTIKIAAVDEKGVPTAWEPVEFPSGGGSGGTSDADWELLNTITIEEEGITAFEFSEDSDGNPLELTDGYMVSDTMASLGGTSANSARVQLKINKLTARYNCGNLASSSRTFAAIATTINGRVWHANGTFSDSNANPGGYELTPVFDRPPIKNVSVITSIGLYIFNPGTEYFAVGYKLSLYGRRKK